MRGPAKVAALLLAMGKPLASRLLKHFDQDELREITRSVAELGVVPMPVIEDMIEEFAGNFAKGAGLMISAERCGASSLGLLSPEEISDIMSDVTGNSNQSIWQRLSSVSEVLFAGYLVKEHPQTAAAILSKVTPVCAAKVMGQLPRELRNEIMRRMVGIALVSRAGDAHHRKHACRKICSSTSHATIAMRIMAAWPTSSTRWNASRWKTCLQSLAEARPKAAETLRGLLFTFDDIIKLPAKSRAGAVRSDSDRARRSRAEGNRRRLPQFHPIDTFDPRAPRWSRRNLPTAARRRIAKSSRRAG